MLIQNPVLNSEHSKPQNASNSSNNYKNSNPKIGDKCFENNCIPQPKPQTGEY